MPDLRAVAREQAELIAFLWDNLRPLPSPRPSSKPIPAPKPSSPQSVKLQSNRTKPPKPTRPPSPPPEEDSFDPYELGRAFRKAHQSFRIDGRSRMDVETFLEETRGSVANLNNQSTPGFGEGANNRLDSI